MWGLNDEAIRKVATDRAIVQATLRHVYEEGESLCLEHLTDCPRRNCHWCWAELKAEAGL